MSKKRAILSAFAVLGISLFVAACGSSSSSGGSGDIPSEPEAGTFRMGIEPWLGYGPWRIAEEKGFFEKNGIDVEITNFTTDDQINAAFAAGKLDGSNIATHTALRFATSGLPIKIILLEDESTTADAIMSGKDATSVTDMEGQKVAYEEGTTSDILLSYALAQNGLTKDDIESVPIPAADAGAAFISGKVPFAVTYEPYLTTALNEDSNAKLLYTAGEKPGIVSDVFIVNEDTINSRPGQLVALAKSWNDAVEFYYNNTAEAQAIIEKAVGADPGSLKTAFDGVKFYTLEDMTDLLNGEFRDQTISDVYNAAKDAGLIEGSVDPKNLIDTTFVDEASK